MPSHVPPGLPVSWSTSCMLPCSFGLALIQLPGLGQVNKCALVAAGERLRLHKTWWLFFGKCRKTADDAQIRTPQIPSCHIRGIVVTTVERIKLLLGICEFISLRLYHQLSVFNFISSFLQSFFNYIYFFKHVSLMGFFWCKFMLWLIKGWGHNCWMGMCS